MVSVQIIVLILAIILTGRALIIFTFHMGGIPQEYGSGRVGDHHFRRPSFRMSSKNGKVTIVASEDPPMDERMQRAMADLTRYQESLPMRPYRALLYASAVWALFYMIGVLG